MAWKRWKLGCLVALVSSLFVAGSGLCAGMTWKTFIAVFCSAAITHFGAFLTKHPVEEVQFDSQKSVDSKQAPGA